MILSGQTIRALCQGPSPMLSPFSERTVFRGKSYGVSAAGYDIRIDAPSQYRDFFLLNSGDFELASSMEEFNMPEGIVGIVHDKSTWVRQGLTVQNTVIEPGWKGFLTLELVNHSRDPILIDAGEPIAQIIFHTLDQRTEAPYRGKYQNQERGPQVERYEE